MAALYERGYGEYQAGYEPVFVHQDEEVEEPYHVEEDDHTEEYEEEVIVYEGDYEEPSHYEEESYHTEEESHHYEEEVVVYEEPVEEVVYEEPVEEVVYEEESYHTEEESHHYVEEVVVEEPVVYEEPVEEVVYEEVVEESYHEEEEEDDHHYYESESESSYSSETSYVSYESSSSYHYSSESSDHHYYNRGHGHSHGHGHAHHDYDDVEPYKPSVRVYEQPPSQYSASPAAAPAHNDLPDGVSINVGDNATYDNHDNDGDNDIVINIFNGMGAPTVGKKLEYGCVSGHGQCRPQCPEARYNNADGTVTVNWTADEAGCEHYAKPSKTTITLFAPST